MTLRTGSLSRASLAVAMACCASYCRLRRFDSPPVGATLFHVFQRTRRATLPIRDGYRPTRHGPAHTASTARRPGPPASGATIARAGAPSKWLGLATALKGGSGFGSQEERWQAHHPPPGDETNPAVAGKYDRIRIERDGTTEEIRPPAVLPSGTSPRVAKTRPHNPREPEVLPRILNKRPALRLYETEKTDADEPPLKRFSALLLAATTGHAGCRPDGRRTATRYR